jgi:hypothetical protein
VNENFFNLNEGNQIHNSISSSGSGSDFLTSYGSGSGSVSNSQKVTVPIPAVPIPVPQRWLLVRHLFVTPWYYLQELEARSLRLYDNLRRERPSTRTDTTPREIAQVHLSLLLFP